MADDDTPRSRSALHFRVEVEDACYLAELIRVVRSQADAAGELKLVDVLDEAFAMARAHAEAGTSH